jgi:hypothetical protein
MNRTELLRSIEETSKKYSKSSTSTYKYTAANYKKITDEQLVELNDWDSKVANLITSNFSNVDSKDFLDLYHQAENYYNLYSKFNLSNDRSINNYLFQEWRRRAGYLAGLYSDKYEKRRLEKEEQNRINSIEGKKRDSLLNIERIKELSVDELKQELALASRENSSSWQQAHTPEEQLQAKKEAFKASRSNLPREELIKKLLSVSYDYRRPLYVSNHGKGVKRENNAKEHEILGKNIRLGKIPLPKWENNENSNSSNEEKNAILHIKNIYKGALCDSEGFYQHSGECWNDAIQMVFLFSDGLKEVIQNKLANSVIDNTFITDEQLNNIVILYNNIYLPRLGYKAVPEHLKTQFILYFKSLQNRFIRHYTTESKRRNSLSSENSETCPTKKIIHAIHVKGRNAIKGAVFGQGSGTLFSTTNYKLLEVKGANIYDIMFLCGVYTSVFFNKQIIVPTTTARNQIGMLFHGKLPIYSVSTNIGEFHYPSIPLTPIQFKELFNDEIKLQIIRAVIINADIGETGHGMCFYTCGGKDFFYEDNYGPFLFPWRKIMSSPDFNEIAMGSVHGNINGSAIYSGLYPIVKKNDNTYYSYYNNIQYAVDNEEYKVENLEKKTLKEAMQSVKKETLPVLDVPIHFNINTENHIVHYLALDYPLNNVENTSFKFNRGLRLERNGPVLGGKRSKNKKRQTRRYRTRRTMTRKN